MRQSRVCVAVAIRLEFPDFIILFLTVKYDARSFSSAYTLVYTTEITEEDPETVDLVASERCRSNQSPLVLQ